MKLLLCLKAIEMELRFSFGLRQDLLATVQDHEERQQAMLGGICGMEAVLHVGRWIVVGSRCLSNSVRPSFRWPYALHEPLGDLPKGGKPSPNVLAQWIADELDPRVVDLVAGTMRADIAWLCKSRRIVRKRRLTDGSADYAKILRESVADAQLRGPPVLFDKEGQLLPRCRAILVAIPSTDTLSLKEIVHRLNAIGPDKWDGKKLGRYTRALKAIHLLKRGPKLTRSSRGEVLLAHRHKGVGEDRAGAFGADCPNEDKTRKDD